MLKVKLVVVGGDAKAKEVNLKLPTVIGRGKEAGLTVPHALVSRRHTELFERDGKLFVRDLGSLNGTFVDNAKIEGEKYLAPNQLLTLGNITFRAVYEVAAGQVFARPDTVSLEDFKTVEEDQSERVTFEEVPSAEFEAEDDPVESRPELNIEAKVEAKIRTEQTTQPVPAEPVNEKPLVQAVKKEPSFAAGRDEHEDSQGSIELESDIFQFGLDGRPAQEVSSTGLENLPGGPKHASSIDEFRLDGVEAKNQVDSFKIDLGEEANKNQSEVDSGRLASFLKKLP